MNKRLNNIFKGDKVIWMIFFFLCLISIVEVFSASSGLTYKAGNYMKPILKHIGLLAVGIVCMVVTLNIQCKYFRLIIPFLLPFSWLTLIAVLATGQATNDASRWFSFMGIQFQPSELAKGALVLATAQILSKMQTDDGADRNAMKYILIVCAFFIPLIGLENLSTAALLCVTIFLMMVVGRVPMRQLGKLMGVAVLCVAAAAAVVMALGQNTNANTTQANLTEQVAQETEQPEKPKGRNFLHRMDTWKSRIYKFADRTEIAPEDVDLDKDAQTAHANIAIASSGFIGKGPGNSVERDFLSQAFSDFIYAIVIEELGLAGAAFVAMLYITLLFRTGRIANRCENNFPAFLAMGLALLLATQALFNMMVAVGLAPVTGQPLPLISKGGTSSIINCIYIGAILSVSRSAKKNDYTESTETEPAMAVA